MNARNADILCMAIEAMGGFACTLVRRAGRPLRMEAARGGRLIAAASADGDELEFPCWTSDAERLGRFLGVARRRVEKTGRGGIVADAMENASAFIANGYLAAMTENVLCCLRLAAEGVRRRAALRRALDAALRRLAAGRLPSAPSCGRRGLEPRVWNKGRPRTRRSTGRTAGPDPAEWMAARGVRMGDMLDVTNASGRTFTGRLVDFRPPLGYISLDGDPHFAFSMEDAKVAPSARRTPSTFRSRIPKWMLYEVEDLASHPAGWARAPRPRRRAGSGLENGALEVYSNDVRRGEPVD